MSGSSNYYNRLGPQGRSFLAQLQQQPNQSFSQHSNQYNIPIPSQLDYLFNEISNPKPTTTPQQILSYLAYYYPKLKNEQNVQLLTISFLKCPLFFNDNHVISFVENYKILECFKFLMDRKFQISQPTLPFYKFYHSILSGLLRFISFEVTNYQWKIIPIITGCLLSIESRLKYDPYPTHSRLINKIDHQLNKLLEKSLIYSFRFNSNNNDLKVLNLICLSNIPDNSISNNSVIEILKYNPQLPKTIIEMIFNSPYALENCTVLVPDLMYSSLVTEKPVLKHLNKLSFLFSRLISLHPNIAYNFDIIDLILNKLQTFTECLSSKDHLNAINDGDDLWLVLRQIFFSIVIMFENIIAIFFKLNSLSYNKNVLTRFSRKILTCLFNLSFIIDRIGTGGFESYNFIYLSALYSITEYDLKIGELLIQVWTSSINFTKINGGDSSSSFIESSKLLFNLNFIESIINICSDDLKFNLILPIINKLISSTTIDQPILESSHSVMLKFFTILDTHVDNDEIQIDYNLNMLNIKNKIINYLTLSLDQFPDQLSLNQVGIIVETLARIAFPNSIIYETDKEIYKSMLNVLYNRCQTITNDEIIDDTSATVSESGFANISSDLQKQQQNQTELKSKKSCLISLLVRLLPLIPINEFECWLGLVYDNLICNVRNPDEKSVLLNSLWTSILGTNKYYPQKGNLGINWWYGYVNVEFDDHFYGDDKGTREDGDEVIKAKL